MYFYIFQKKLKRRLKRENLPKKLKKCIAKESTGSTCTCQVQALPVDSQLTICQHEIARNYLQLGSKNLKNCK